MQLIIGNANYSTWSLRPWLFIAEHGLDVEVQKLQLFSSALGERLSGHFSRGRVPLLLDGDVEVWESLAILDYLSERFGVAGWPEEPAARAVARAVSGEMHSSFGALRNEAPMNIRRRFPGYRLGAGAEADVSRICDIWAYCRDRFGEKGPWLFGDFSIADAMFAPVVMRFRSVDVTLDDNAKTYCDTMNGCRGIREWVRIAYEEDDIIQEDELDWPSTEATMDAQHP